MLELSLDLNIYNTQYDLDAMVQSMNDAQRIVSSQSWADYNLGQFGDLTNATLDRRMPRCAAAALLFVYATTRAR